jgi:hypothetical protein
MNNKAGKILGTLIILIGIYFLLANLNLIEPYHKTISIGRIIALFWPSLFLILPGLLFHYGFISGGRRDAGLLVPGGILLVLGVAFQINMLFGGWKILWPMYIFAVAVGLFELYYFGGREKGLLVPVCILGGLSVLFFLAFSVKELIGVSAGAFILPAALIIAGLLIIFGKKKVA